LRQEPPAINWHDSPLISASRVVLTEAQLRIPGVRTLGWYDMASAKMALAPHYHENAFEITFVTNGHIDFYIGDERSTVRGGDAFLVPPDVVHGTKEVPMSVGEICWVQLDVSDPDRFLFLNREAAAELIAALHAVKENCIRTDNGLVTKLLRRALRTVLDRPADSPPALVASYLTLCLHLLLGFAGTPSDRMTPDIVRVCAYIRGHLGGELTAEELAGVGLLSVSQFKAKFKQQTGTSPRHYVNQQKILEAERLLRRRGTVTRVAADLGYCSSSYFSVVFKKYTGLTPTEYLSRGGAERKEGEA